MVVVAFHLRIGRDPCRFSAINRQPINPSILVEQEVRSVARPVRRLKMRLRHVRHAPIRRRNRHRLKRAVKHRLLVGRCKRLHLYIRKHRRLRRILIVRGNSNSDVERTIQDQLCRRARWFQLSIRARNKRIEIVAALLQPHPLRPDHIRLHLVIIRACGIAKLQRRQPIAMPRNIDCRRIPIQALPYHQHRLAMVFPLSPTNVMSAEIATSPLIFFHANWKSSMPNHMFSPLPVTV